MASSSVYCSVQALHIVKFQLPIPLALAVLSTIAPLINFAAQPLGQYFLRTFSMDCGENAVRLLNVGSL
jgi:hypothetical protein